MKQQQKGKRHVELLLVNIRSLWNVGSMFRTADAFSIRKIHLCGYTALPPRREISKTALGADTWISWEHADDAIKHIKKLRTAGFRIVGLEITQGAQDISGYVPSDCTALVVGNEVEGLSEDILKLCDDCVCIPMSGKKESLNVAVAAGIALQRLRSA